MTPAERARQIDKEEFAAECAAIRKRAYAMLRRNAKRDARVAAWIKRGFEPAKVRAIRQPSPPRPGFKPPETARRPANNHEAFGKVQSLAQWAEEYSIATSTIRTRLALGWTLEDALRTPVSQTGKRAHRPGVPSDFPPSEGTGAGSTAQATASENNFSRNEA